MDKWLVQTGKGKGSYRTVSAHPSIQLAAQQYAEIDLTPGEKKRLIGKPGRCQKFLTFARNTYEESK